MQLRTPLWNSPMCFSDLRATETVSGGIGATDHLAFTALKQAAVVTAMVLCHVAMRDQRMPR